MTKTVDEASTGPAVKVTVIVPTYCPGEGLARVIQALDGQSMNQDDFESLFIDDGSPDGTHQRLLGLARERPNMRVSAIPNSGWPSRPRNLGVRMARGDYVVFMDHDDELYPTALEDAWSFADKHNLDALNAKETKGSSRYFTWSAFQSDVGSATLKTPLLLSPMTPHKMYRRQFLLDHGIVFPEGGAAGGKVQWEDIHFNIDVYAHTDRLGVLASRPFYHWVTGTGSNNSASYGRDPDEYWRHLSAIFEHLDESPMDQASADRIRASQYANRVLAAMVGPRALKRDPQYYAKSLNHAIDFAERWVPRRIDESLEAIGRARSALLRNGHEDLLIPLAELDQGVTARPVATDVRLVNGKLEVSSVARWANATGQPLDLRLDAERLMRVLPERISRALTPELLDLSGALAHAQGQLSVAGRDTWVAWPIESHFETRLVEITGDRVALDICTTAVVDPSSGAMGHPLPPDRWRLACRSSFAGFNSHPYLAYSGPTLRALIDGHVLVARASKSAHLVFDVADSAGPLLAATAPDVEGAEVRSDGRSRALVIPVPGVSTTGRTRLPVRFLLREVGPDDPTCYDGVGCLVSDGEGVTVDLVLPPTKTLRRGRYRLLVDEPGEGWERGQGWVSELVLRVGRLGRFAVTHEPAPRGRRRPVWR